MLYIGPFHANGSDGYSALEKEQVDTFVEMCRDGGLNAVPRYNHVYVQAARWIKLAWYEYFIVVCLF